MTTRCRAKRFRGWFQRTGVWNATVGGQGVIWTVHMVCRAGHVSEWSLFR